MVAAGAALIEPKLSPDACSVAYLIRRGGEVALVTRQLGAGPGLHRVWRESIESPTEPISLDS